MSGSMPALAGSVDHGWKGRVRLPKLHADVPQDAEWCEILENGRWTRLRFHDYDAIYERPGLYEHLFYELLECDSPRRVVGLLAQVRRDRDQGPFGALDLGAGNGIVGEELRRAGATRVVGIDILKEAAVAARRDRPGLYDDYVVADLTAPDDDAHARLERARPDALACVAALGFGDIPPSAYYYAASFIPVGGQLAFNIKDEFLDKRFTHGFSELIRRMIDERVIRLEAWLRYRHRLSAGGEPIFYTAMVATKLAGIPRSMLVDP
jgi:hypothetical protein